jgi:hypothetical protein
MCETALILTQAYDSFRWSVIFVLNAHFSYVMHSKGVNVYNLGMYSVFISCNYHTFLIIIETNGMKERSTVGVYFAII